jgi:hypothetical protein
MTENVDTYVLPEDSDRFLSEVLPTSDPLRITWEVLTDEEKEGYLSAALREIEEMNFIGDKAYFYQPLKFPRIARGLPVNFEKAPMEVKRAQALCAADIARKDLYIRRRNKEACIALGVGTDTPADTMIKERLNGLLHRWVTRWRTV